MAKHVLWEAVGEVEHDYEYRSVGAVVRVWCEEKEVWVRFEVVSNQHLFGREGHEVYIVVYDII